MNLSRIDLNLLLVFTSIYNEKTITKAAEKLNLSQSAVSNALNRLRYTLDDDLFFRSSDMMKPTKKAEDLIYPIQNALDSIQSSLSDEEFPGRGTKYSNLISINFKRRFGEIKKSRVRFYNFL